MISGLSEHYRFIAADLREFADSDKPHDGYEPTTIAKDMLALLAAEQVETFHILSHDLGPAIGGTGRHGIRPHRVAGHDPRPWSAQIFPSTSISACLIGISACT